MFIDTNVLVNSRIPSAPFHETARQRLEEASQGLEPLRISRQVLREYLAVVTRPQRWSPAITLEDALDDVESLSRNLEVLEDGPAVTESLVNLCRNVPAGGRQIHDANIVATMVTYGERRLLTFNHADFRRYGDRVELIGT